MYYSLLLRSQVRNGTGDFWCRLECETGSYQTFLPFRVVGGFGNIWNISWCLDFFTVFSANFIESCFLLAGSISSFRSLHPFSYSLPVIVATAFLWTLERECDCLLVIALVHTGQFASKRTLPSLFQNSARVVLSTPSCYILLSLQIVFVSRRASAQAATSKWHLRTTTGGPPAPSTRTRRWVKTVPSGSFFHQSGWF